MESRRWLVSAVALTLLMGMVMLRAHAAVTYHFGSLASGTTPSGSAPWATLSVVDYGLNEVQFTLTANLLDPQEFISVLYLNINPYVSASLVSGSVSGGATLTANAVNNGHTVLGNRFDLKVAFPTAMGPDRLTGSEWVQWRLTGSGLTASHFLALSEKASGGAGDYYTLLHVQGIPGGGSGWITHTSTSSSPTPPPHLPEPGTLLLFATGLVTPLVMRVRRR